MSPSGEYAQRLQSRLARAAHYEQLHLRMGYVRLFLAASAAVAAWLAFKRHLISPWWLALPVVLFLVLAVYHARVLQARSCAERAAEVYRRGLARLEDRWAGTGETGDRFHDPRHVYAGDLDLFGRGGLFQLLSMARTRMGEETLAGWLLEPSAVADILPRHAAVAELRDQLDLREDLAVLGEDARVGVHPEALRQWAEAPGRLSGRQVPLLALMLTGLFLASVVLWALTGMALPFVAVLIVEYLFAFRFRRQVAEVLHDTEHAFEDLELLSAVLARFEREPFRAPRLRELEQQLSSHHLPGSLAIARLRTIVDLINSRDNLFLRVLNVPLMYSIQVAFLAEAWRRRHGSAVRRWVGALGEIEALISLAAYSYEHPEDPFPEFSDGAAMLAGEELGHPLLAAGHSVRNTVAMGGETRVLLVSGSNMSGKSTLLRAVGVNTVLAMAGAPVRARRMRLSPLRVGASIRINDSLQEGSSRFYSEILRLRHIFDLASGDLPLLFLLDELLQGTNSHDRQIGAEGIVRALVERGAIGLISTHDLALTRFGEGVNRHVHNVHFQDELEDGKIRFDYKLREGVVEKSNGLELMRSVGLDV